MLLTVRTYSSLNIKFKQPLLEWSLSLSFSKQNKKEEKTKDKKCCQTKLICIVKMCIKLRQYVLALNPSFGQTIEFYKGQPSEQELMNWIRLSF